ncbi:MAG TPA: hypothetical protein VKH43_03505 [Thermoanaerobaculia bacterium]|nr:hypothetical protein [Thermoanaerobaculia bacterium]
MRRLGVEAFSVDGPRRGRRFPPFGRRVVRTDPFFTSRDCARFEWLTFDEFPYLIVHPDVGINHVILLPERLRKESLQWIAEQQRLVGCRCENWNRCARCHRPFQARRLGSNFFDPEDGNIRFVPGFLALDHRC